MKNYIRRKPRQTGKTENLIEMAKIQIEMGKTILIVVNHRDSWKRFKDALKDYNNKSPFKYQYSFATFRTISSSCRGRSLDSVLVDDWEDMYAKQQNELLECIAPMITKPILITTS